MAAGQAQIESDDVPGLLGDQQQKLGTGLRLAQRGDVTLSDQDGSETDSDDGMGVRDEHAHLRTLAFRRSS